MLLTFSIVNQNKSQKLYFEPQLFTQQKNESDKKLLTKFGIVMLATQVSHILSHSLKSDIEPLDQRSLFFFNFNFQSICPNQMFLLC